VSIDSIDSSTDACAPVVTISHKDICPVFSASSWFSYLSEHPYIFVPVLVVLGAAVGAFGRQFFSYTIAGFGAITGFIATLLLFSVTLMLENMTSTDSTSSSSSSSSDSSESAGAMMY
jgi:hypothetical protein